MPWAFSKRLKSMLMKNRLDLVRWQSENVLFRSLTLNGKRSEERGQVQCAFNISTVKVSE